MELEYHEKAKENGVYIVSACGFESIPADLGIVYLKNEFKGTVNSIESFFNAKVNGNPKVREFFLQFVTELNLIDLYAFFFFFF